MGKRILKGMVQNSVDNILNNALGPRTIEELLPKLANHELPCSKPCNCARNKGPNGLPAKRPNGS